MQNFERFETQNNLPASLDEKWYKNFESLSFDTYEYLSGDGEKRKEIKEKFLADDEGNPELDYPKLEEIDLDKKEQKLLNLKEQIANEEKNEAVRQAYRWKINEQIASVRMLQATKSGDDEKYHTYSKFVYGSPSPELFMYTMKEVSELAERGEKSDSQFAQAAAKRLRAELFDDRPMLEHDITVGGADVPEKSETSESEDQITAEQAKEMFEEVLEKEKEFGEWQAVIDESGSRSGFSASQSEKTLHIPNDEKIKQRKKPLTKDRLKALIEHEIMTHALRREKGERSRLKLLGLGLDRYLEGEEGVATYKQQESEGAKRFSVQEKHFAIALAMGLDGTKRDFREVFNILRDYHLCVKEPHDESGVKEAQTQAWKTCVRIFRGTTANTKGAVFTKDIVYREGNISVRQLIKDNPEEMEKFTLGKYDPRNERHLWILSQLGITDDELNE